MGIAERARRIQVQASDHGRRLDNFLSSLLGAMPKSHIYKLIRTGQVRVNRRRYEPKQRLSEGDWVRLPPIRLKSASEPKNNWCPQTLIEEEQFCVVNKPANMAVHGGSAHQHGLIDYFRHAKGCQDWRLVHRLDKATSGCLLLAKGAAQTRLWQGSDAPSIGAKRYLACVSGRFPSTLRTLSAPIEVDKKRNPRLKSCVGERGKHALSRVRLLSSGQDYSLIAIELKTGRTHQIRVHLAHTGYPVVGDERYGPDRRARMSLMLHAHSLQLNLEHRRTVWIQAPIPESMKRFAAEAEINLAPAESDWDTL